MYINTNNSNQSLRIQDNNSLSEQLPTNTIQNTPIFMPFKNHFTLVETSCLYKHGCACSGTDVSREAQGVSSKAHTVPTINFYRAQTGNKVDIYKKLK